MDDLTAKFEAYLKSLTPAQSDKIAKELQAQVEFDLFLEAETERRRCKGLKGKDVMVFSVTCTITCTTCGAQHISQIMSSNLKPVFAQRSLCGQCEKVLGAMTVAQLVDIIMKKERAFYARSHDEYKPKYIPPASSVFEDLPIQAAVDVSDEVVNESVILFDTSTEHGAEVLLDNPEDIEEDVLP